jgi:hypothetical protein
MDAEPMTTIRTLDEALAWGEEWKRAYHLMHREYHLLELRMSVDLAYADSWRVIYESEPLVLAIANQLATEAALRDKAERASI